MKNLKLLPEDLRYKVQKYQWNCGCRQEHLRLSVTKKGTIQAHCFACGQTIFWNDVQMFYFENPFSYLEEDPIKKTMKKGGTTRWFPKHRVRVFNPE